MFAEQWLCKVDASAAEWMKKADVWKPKLEGLSRQSTKLGNDMRHIVQVLKEQASSVLV